MDLVFIFTYIVFYIVILIISLIIVICIEFTFEEIKTSYKKKNNKYDDKEVKHIDYMETKDIKEYLEDRIVNEKKAVEFNMQKDLKFLEFIDKLRADLKKTDENVVSEETHVEATSSA